MQRVVKILGQEFIFRCDDRHLNSKPTKRQLGGVPLSWRFTELPEFVDLTTGGWHSVGVVAQRSLKAQEIPLDCPDLNYKFEPSPESHLL